MTKTRLRGVIPAITTPVTVILAPDPPRFLAHARHLLAEGADGLNVLGTTGETTSFPVQHRMELMTVIAASDLPKDRLMVGTGAAATADAEVLTRHADSGFAGALVLPPFYYKGVGIDGILRYFDRLASRSSIPLYLYNFPALSGVPYTEELVSALVARFPGRIAGLKDSSGDLAYARRIAALSDSLDVFPSSEGALDEARGGVFAGCISATVNVSARQAAAALHQADDAALARARVETQSGPPDYESCDCDG